MEEPTKEQGKPGRKRRIVVLIAAFSPLVLVGLLLWWLDQTARRQSTEAAAEIIEATAVSWTEDDGNRLEFKEGYALKYRFWVDGQMYEGEDSQNESYGPNAPVKVCYNPNDPADYSLVASTVQCGKGLLGR
ncbi:MAG: hypothetical protein HY704_00255 [Gemmatimonadetes bacterium]|nr:hypothetical protein [Gemmatimonadota bacterium]